jgi:hypothetical protein
MTLQPPAVPMLKERPDHFDAELILRVYDLRREAVLRESRNGLVRDYWPRTEEDALAVLHPDHPPNRPWRQVTGYWEMVYSLARHGVVHAEFLVESNGEGLFLFARAERYLEALRGATSPRTLRNAEWVARETELGRQMMETFRARVAKRLASG